MLPDRGRFPAALNIWPFLRLGGNFKSNTGHFYIDLEYKTNLNFGDNFSKKKVHLKRPLDGQYFCTVFEVAQ